MAFKKQPRVIATATNLIKMEPVGNNKNFPNFFKKLGNPDGFALVESQEKWYKIRADISCNALVYLYAKLDIDMDITVELGRTACQDINAPIDEDCIVTIPGSTKTVFAADKAFDYTIAGFGGDTLYIKITTPAGFTGTINELCLLLK